MANARDGKKAEFDAFVADVRSALEEAHSAAKESSDAFLRSAQRTKDGHVADMCGGGSIVVNEPSYRLREALKSLGEVQRGALGEWIISTFVDVGDQSITAQERACYAARDVLQRRLPDDGEFRASIWVD